MDFGTPPPKTTTQSTKTNASLSITPATPSSSSLSFGAASVTTNNNTSVVTENKNSLNFGNSTQDINSKLGQLKTPTTVCIPIGGSVNNLESIVNQLSGTVDKIISSINPPKLPNVEIPKFNIPSLAIPVLPPITISTSQLLQQLSDQCEAIFLNKLDELDPVLRMQKLLDKLGSLCNSLAFGQMQDIINKIEQTKIQMLHNLINDITDPAQKIAKLAEIAQDAINSNNLAFLNTISGLMNTLIFNDLIQTIQALDPAIALGELETLLKQQLQLKNFTQVKQLLSIINQVKQGFNATTNLGAIALDLPEMTIDQLQNQINNLLSLQNYDEISKLISSFETSEQAAIQAIQSMSPEQALALGQKMLQEALKNLDMAKINQIISQLGANVCNNAANLIPSPPTNLPGSGAISSFLIK